MDNIYGLLIVIVLYVISPGIAYIITLKSLSIIRGNRLMIFTLLISLCLIIMSLSICGFFILNGAMNEDFIYTIIIGIVELMFIFAFLERAIVSSLDSDTEFHSNRYEPDDASTVRVEQKNKVKLKLLAWYILILNNGIYLSMLYLLIKLVFDLESNLPYILIAFFASMLIIYISIFRLFVKCENCNNNVFEFYKREFVKLSLNVIMNKYFICMYCHARFSLDKSVNLDKLDKNYQDMDG